MPQPVEIDIAVGIGGERAVFHLETLAHVDPLEFVVAVQEFARALLGVGEFGTPRASDQEDNGLGLLSGDGGSAPGQSGTGSPEPVTTDARWERMEERRKARIDSKLKQRGVA